MTISTSLGGGIGLNGPWTFKDSTTGVWAPPPLGSGDSLIARITAVPAPPAAVVLALGFLGLRRRS